MVIHTLDTKPSYKMCHLFNQAAQSTINCLLENPEAYTYLRVERGFDDTTRAIYSSVAMMVGALKFLTDKGWDTRMSKGRGLSTSTVSISCGIRLLSRMWR